MNDPATGNTVRRRRSWYRRRLHTRQIVIAAVAATLIAAACWQNAARHLRAPSLRASRILPEAARTRGNVGNNLAWMAARSAKPKKLLAPVPDVYPYSVVPGGVKGSDDLRSAAVRDYVVRRHFAHFDFLHAQLVRVTEARAVYLSYRIRNTVFWTRKKVRLRPGELLLTDGKITARAHCGNQISDTAKPEVSSEEPDEDILDQPVAQMDLGPALPIRPLLSPPDLPAGQPAPPTLFAGGYFFPVVPVVVPLPSKVCPAGDISHDGRCYKRHKPPVVPEPPTLVLFASGLAAMIVACRYRRKPAQ